MLEVFGSSVAVPNDNSSSHQLQEFRQLPARGVEFGNGLARPEGKRGPVVMGDRKYPIERPPRQRLDLREAFDVPTLLPAPVSPLKGSSNFQRSGLEFRHWHCGSA